MRIMSTVAISLFAVLFMTAAVQAADGEYILGPGDVVEVMVWKEENLTRDVLIRPDGMFSFPLIGEVQAVGRTIAEVQAEMQERMEEYVLEARIAVMLKEMNSRSIFIVGKVVKPGGFPMYRNIRVMEAIALAGGLTPYADDDILVVRESQSGQTVMPFDYSDVASGKNLEQNIVLSPGDTIIVR